MRRPRKQFSIRFLLIIATLCAIGVAAWKAFIWEPPTDKISSYEKAPAFFGLTASVGPNQIRIASVARNDRDGTVTVETGKGESSDASIPHRDWLIESAKWLDVVQIDLRPDGELLDIIELRIFDHVKRESITTADPLAGWRVVDPNVIQIYGCGKEIPDKLDVWMRVHSYAKQDEVFKLPPKKGASITVNGRVVTINAVQNGSRGWSSATGFFPVEGTHHGECAIELGWEGAPNVGRYQVAAVSNQGEKLFENLFMAFGSTAGKTMGDFNLPLDSVSHFEVRPFGGRHRFFFNGLELPKTKPPTAKNAFANPPKATLKVGGTEVAQSIPEFLPLDVRFSIRDGHVWNGSRSNGAHVSLIPKDNGPTDRGTHFSLMLDTRGLSDFPYQLRFRTSGNKTWVSEKAIGSRGGGAASGAGIDLSHRTYRSPLADIDEVELSLVP